MSKSFHMHNMLINFRCHIRYNFVLYKTDYLLWIFKGSIRVLLQILPEKTFYTWNFVGRESVMTSRSSTINNSHNDLLFKYFWDCLSFCNFSRISLVCTIAFFGDSETICHANIISEFNKLHLFTYFSSYKCIIIIFFALFVHFIGSQSVS